MLFLSLAGGCSPQRRISITSDPPGARVWLNDVEIGRTPAAASFKFYGAYDVRLELDGFEPLHEVRRAEAPVWEYPGLDLVAMAVPGRKRVEVDWHFTLSPTLEASQSRATVEGDLLSRARSMRERLSEGQAASAPVADPGDAPTEAAAPVSQDAPTPPRDR